MESSQSARQSPRIVLRKFPARHAGAPAYRRGKSLTGLVSEQKCARRDVVDTHPDPSIDLLSATSAALESEQRARRRTEDTAVDDIDTQLACRLFRRQPANIRKSTAFLPRNPELVGKGAIFGDLDH